MKKSRAGFLLATFDPRLAHSDPIPIAIPMAMFRKSGKKFGVQRQGGAQKRCRDPRTARPLSPHSTFFCRAARDTTILRVRKNRAALQNSLRKNNSQHSTFNAQFFGTRYSFYGPSPKSGRPTPFTGLARCGKIAVPSNSITTSSGNLGALEKVIL